MNLLCLTVGTRAPSTRFRIKQYQSLLAAAGISASFRSADEGPGYLGQLIRRWQVLRSIDPRALLLLQKPNYVLYPTVAVRFLTKIRNDVVFDFDDAIFIDPATGGPRARGVLHVINYLMARSKVVTVGNGHLAEYARAYNENVRIIPTAIDTDFYRPTGTSVQARVVVGWMGSRQNLADLASINKVLLDLLSRKRRKLLVVSNAREHEFREITGLNHPNVMYALWSEDTEKDLLSRMDIGLMPLRSSAYALGKCGFKVIQYMAMGKPAVASAIGANAEIIQHGVTGSLISNEAHWLSSLEELVEDQSRREMMGREARIRAVERYSVNAVFPHLLGAINF